MAVVMPTVPLFPPVPFVLVKKCLYPRAPIWYCVSLIYYAKNIVRKYCVPWLARSGVVLSSLILFILMIQVIRSPETLVLTRATWCHIQEDCIHHSHRRENLKSYLALTIWAL
jgi:hypothetical protein